MKTKFIVASTIGLLGVTSMVLGTVTLAGNTTMSNTHGMRMGSGQKMGMGSGAKMMNQFASTAEAEAFRTAVEKAISNGDYTAFVAVHTKYKVNTTMTEEQFKEMLTKKATQEKIQTALEAGDYSTRKTLNTGRPILNIIDTEAKFKQLQEMHSYNEKARTIREELGMETMKGKGMGMGMGKGMKGGRGMGMNNTARSNQ